MTDEGLKDTGRRKIVALLGALLAVPRASGQVATRNSSIAPPAPVVPGYTLRFPHDEGSHPAFRLEWWYVTGWLNPASRRPRGFQITFFRARPDLKHANPSAFTPRHILIAHAALSDPAHGRLVHAQRAARAGFGLAGADEGRTRAWIDDWTLEQGAGGYHASIRSDQMEFSLLMTPRQPPLLQGENGFSRKGPAPEAASYYYSLPHLAVSGTVVRGHVSEKVTGNAWLDHEWSSHYLPEEAVGWDWIGVNFDDGSTLMAFRMRSRDGGQYWAGGTLRHAIGTVHTFAPGEIRFAVARQWRSPRSGATYPVSLRLGAGELELAVEPLMDDQEYDARASAGTIYWEGAVRVARDGKTVGRGYLELTGYWRRMNLGSTQRPPPAPYRLPA